MKFLTPKLREEDTRSNKKLLAQEKTEQEAATD
jgi:hypothetical protein